MQITLIAIGTRGDVQPLIALGKGLQSAGHRVRLVAGDEFQELVSRNGIEFTPLGLDVQATIESHTDVFQFMNSIKANILEAITKRQDAIVTTFLGISACPVARTRHIPFFYALPIPSVQTHQFPNPLFPPLPLGKAYNALTHRLAEKRVCQMNVDARCLFMEPRPTYLCCYSSEVVPRPTDWPDCIHVTGYWFLDEAPGYQPAPVLSEFLQAGNQPLAVSLGSGSGTIAEVQRLMAVAAQALALADQRAVVVTGHRPLDLQLDPKRFFVTDSIPFDWLIPKMAAVVHHGGAGTTSVALRAGVPSIVLPFGLDQFFWARRVDQLGVGIGTLKTKRLTPRRLAAAMSEAIMNTRIRTSAIALGKAIRREDGVGNAVGIIEKTLSVL